MPQVRLRIRLWAADAPAAPFSKRRKLVKEIIEGYVALHKCKGFGFVAVLIAIVWWVAWASPGFGALLYFGVLFYLSEVVAKPDDDLATAFMFLFWIDGILVLYSFAFLWRILT